VSALLLVVCLAAPPLAKELATFDPVNLPRKEAKALRAEVARRAKARYGSFAGDHYAELWGEIGTTRKRERLVAATARQREALEAEGSPDHSPATQFVCEVYAVLEQRRLAVDRQREELRKEYRSLVTGEPTGKHKIKLGSQERAAILTGDRVLLREYAYHLLRLRIRCVHLLELKKAPDSERYLVRQALKAKQPHLRARVAEVLSRRPDVPLGVFLACSRAGSATWAPARRTRSNESRRSWRIPTSACASRWRGRWRGSTSRRRSRRSSRASARRRAARATTSRARCCR
jgi:hypothetical protein